MRISDIHRRRRDTHGDTAPRRDNRRGEVRGGISVMSRDVISARDVQRPFIICSSAQIDSS